MTDSAGLCGLYAILDDDAWRRVGIELGDVGVVEALTEVIVSTRPAALQLRAKHLEAMPTLDLLRRLGPIARAAGVPVFANDRVDIALLARAFGVCGVHVGQHDLPFEAVVRIAGELSVGVSTHSRAQLERALANARRGLDYVAVGPVFATTSKANAEPTLGTPLLAEMVALAADANVPLVAIGGISGSNIELLANLGVRCAAVISDLVLVDGDGQPALEELRDRANALGAALRRDET